MAENDEQSQAESDANSSADMIMTDEKVRAINAGYEQQYGMTSEEFLRHWKAGTAPDIWETNDWAMLLESV